MAAQSIRFVTATATLNGCEDVIIFNSTSDITFSLGPAYGDGRTFTLKNVNTGIVTLSPASGETLEGLSSAKLDKSDSIELCDYAAETWMFGYKSKDETPFYSVTDPATNAAVSAAITDIYGGVLITTTGAGNAQTIANPSVTTEIKKFTVINNDTSTNTIAVNGITLPAGKAQSWMWDGSAWIEIDLGITALPVPYNQGGTGVAVTGVNHIFYVDGARTDSYTADGSMSRPYKTILAAQNAVNVLSATLLGSAANFELCKFIVNIAPGKYTDNVAISTVRYLRWNLEGVEVSGNVTITQNQLGLTDYYGKVEFFGGLGNRAYRGNCGLFSGTITFLKDAYDSLAYDAFIGCNITGNLQYGTSTADTHGTWVLCLINSYFQTGSKFISAYLTAASEHVMIESYGYNKIVAHIAKQDGSATKVTLYDCNNTYFDLVNTTPLENCTVKNCTFNSDTSIVAAKTLYIDANSYKSLVAQTETLTGMTISPLDGILPTATNVNITNLLLQVHSDSGRSTTKIHAHLMPVTTEYANEFKGEFLSTGAVGQAQTMDGIAAHYHMAASGSGIMRSILGVAYLDSGVTLTGTDYTLNGWLAGGVFVADVAGTIVGNQNVIAGLYAGIGSCQGGTLTACKYMTAIWATSNRLTTLSAGQSSLIFADNPAGTDKKAVDYGLRIEGGSGMMTTGISIAAPTTTAIDITGACTRGIRLGTHDWGVGLTGLILSTTDPLFQVAGRIAASNSTAGVYSCSYKQLALTSATQNTDTSWFADWNELYITPTTTTVLTGSSHYAAIKGHIEVSGTVTSSTGVTASLWGSNIIPAGYVNDGTIAGCYIDGIIHTSMTNNGDTMAFGIGAHNDPNQGDWEYGLYMPDATVSTGIKIGSCTTHINLSGAFTGNSIDFSSVTYVPTGSAGPCLIRAGSYDVPLTNSATDQSGLIRLYMQTSADGSSYDRAIFSCLKTTGTKGIITTAGLAEVLADATGPANVKGCEFIVDLHETGSNLPASGIAYGGWFKITAIDGATINATAKIAPLWLDNQLYGANASNCLEYTIWNTTGGSKPRAWAGFGTTSDGWKQLFFFDSTMAAVEPFVATGAVITVDGGTHAVTLPYLKVLVNATQYGIPLVAI